MNTEAPYFCFDHALWYGADGFMCPACEREICEEHDKMIDVIHKIQYGDTGSGDFAEVTVDSIENGAILLGNESIRGDSRVVIYKDEVDNLINTLKFLKETYL